MLAKVMKNTRMMSPQKTEVVSVMDGMIKVIAEYRNTHGAIGYAFRYYATHVMIHQRYDKNRERTEENGI